MAEHLPNPCKVLGSGYNPGKSDVATMKTARLGFGGRWSVCCLGSWKESFSKEGLLELCGRRGGMSRESLWPEGFLVKNMSMGLEKTVQI